MRDCIEIGCTPSGEECEQLGPNYDRSKAIRECRAYARQIHRIFPELENHDKVWLRLKSEYHDFGTYTEVAVSFDLDDEASVDLAYRIEGGTPEFWDEEAKAELGLILS